MPVALGSAQEGEATCSCTPQSGLPVCKVSTAISDLCPPAPRSGTSLQYKAQPENPTPHLELQENTNRTMERC